MNLTPRPKLTPEPQPQKLPYRTEQAKPSQAPVPCISHDDADTGVEVGEFVHPTGEPLELELGRGLEDLSHHHHRNVDTHKKTYLETSLHVS